MYENWAISDMKISAKVTFWQHIRDTVICLLQRHQVCIFTCLWCMLLLLLFFVSFYYIIFSVYFSHLRTDKHKLQNKEKKQALHRRCKMRYATRHPMLWFRRGEMYVRVVIAPYSRARCIERIKKKRVCMYFCWI